MREILFRGKRTDDGKWTAGDLWQNKGTYICPFGTGEIVRIEPSTAGQYTGLCDKNGTKIFEGDVCEDARGFRFAVIWDDDARFLGRGIGKQREYIRYVGQEPVVKIIGNIYDNHDLLSYEVSPSTES